MHNLEHLHLLSTAEVASKLGVTPQTVARRVRSGDLLPVGKGAGVRGPYMFDAARIEALAAGTAAAPAVRTDANPQPEATR